MLVCFTAFVIAWVGAARLEHPGSRWARRRHGTRRREHAARRAAAFDGRWDPIIDRLSNLIAVKPTTDGA